MIFFIISFQSNLSSIQNEHYCLCNSLYYVHFVKLITLRLLVFKVCPWIEKSFKALIFRPRGYFNPVFAPVFSFSNNFLPTYKSTKLFDTSGLHTSPCIIFWLMVVMYVKKCVCIAAGANVFNLKKIIIYML